MEEEIILQRLLQVDAHMYETVFVQDESIRKYCQNEVELCTFWATIGECKSSPGYMARECAPACFSCSPNETATTHTSPENQASVIGKTTPHTFHDFCVAGRNLASYRFEGALAFSP